LALDAELDGDVLVFDLELRGGRRGNQREHQDATDSAEPSALKKVMEG
jgi:hypothetical protein